MDIRKKLIEKVLSTSLPESRVTGISISPQDKNPNKTQAMTFTYCGYEKNNFWWRGEVVTEENAILPSAEKPKMVKEKNKFSKEDSSEGLFFGSFSEEEKIEKNNDEAEVSRKDPGVRS